METGGGNSGIEAGIESVNREDVCNFQSGIPGEFSDSLYAIEVAKLNGI